MNRRNSYLCWGGKIMSVLAISLLFFAHPAYATFPPAPVQDGLPELTAPPMVSAERRLGRVELVVGEVTLISAEGRYSIPDTGVDFAPGDVIVSGSMGRFRLLLEGQDVLHVGKNSLISLDRDAEKQWVMTVWRGALSAYVFPSLHGKRQFQTVRFPHGVVKIPTGKTGILIDSSGSASRLLAIKNVLTWHDNSGSEHHLSQGMGVRIDSSAGSKEEVLSVAFERDFTMLTSPEGPLVAVGLQFYENKQYEKTITALTRVQAVFPYNSLVAYYLGLAHLAKDDLGPTISQWRLYEKIDPQGAQKNEVSQNLTVLISKRMKEEVSEALASEQSLSQSEPEPDSVAIPPFANKGQAKFNVMAKGITAMIIADLSKVPGIKVLERAKMQQLVNEIKLSQSGLVSEETKVRAGRLMRAEKLIMGDYAVE